ncbi:MULTISPECIES: type II CAAX endopeptidase family protein [unclassified Bacillus (in: firmicutes)]|uniref:CPBP family intramembrane glutamic endopeptidase n=1 Tax=unclassified Bacillus (in: firmicutes) TaxID=185979 RepID=UPI001BE50645|nr:MULTISPECIES: type II CAAX endopeptidase family protein [unclassified Bacillus (in: firmicutes)]MBT2640552.1 CPBP family intramembrane metalloprotease [Bacillus sp. ISL-39]MBT2662274.1 CPBP family intramembrane metalloprotease [Bacillus sp. ISL-45]
MKKVLLLVGPTLMIFIGLQVLGNVIATFILFYSWLLAVPLLGRGIQRERFKVTGKAVMLGVGSGLLFFLFIYGGLYWLNIYLLDIDQLRVLLLGWGFSGRGEIWLVLVLLVANPILEEVYWRGYIYEKLRMQGSSKYAILITATFYTLYHLLSVIPIFEGFYGIIAVVPVFIAGIFWGYIREKTGMITAAIFGHVLSDLGIIFVYWFLIR